MTELLEVVRLPAAPLEAEQVFLSEHLQTAQRMMAEADLLIMLPSADHTHRAWRLAVVQELARAAPPRRVNMIAGTDRNAISATAEFLATAEGVTGQYLVTDGPGLDFAVSSP